MVEAVGRLLPGVVGNPESLLEESHADGLLEYPVYTKPSAWRGLEVPEVLLSGNHARIARYRRDEQFQRTAARRPDLLAGLEAAGLSKKDRNTLWALGYEVVDGRLRLRSAD
jgi:tRNA (guanine37-N1)-methyltransferase